MSASLAVFVLLSTAASDDPPALLPDSPAPAVAEAADELAQKAAQCEALVAAMCEKLGTCDAADPVDVVATADEPAPDSAAPRLSDQ